MALKPVHFVPKVLLFFFVTSLLCLVSSVSASYYQGDDLGYLDNVNVNGRLFEDFNENEIVFFAEDLRKGKVEITGILECEVKRLKVSDLLVQISLDGGDTWKNAKGDRLWRFVFSPKIEHAYNLSIRVVKRQDGTLDGYQLGDFLLRTAAKPVKNVLRGQATLALGWLGQYVPAAFKKLGSDELLLDVHNLAVAGNRITSGTVTFEHQFNITVAGNTFSISSLSFSASGASAQGSVSLSADILPSAPDYTFESLAFTKSGIVYDLDVISADNPQSIEIIPGNFGVNLSLSALSFHIDTSNQLSPIALSGLNGSVLLGQDYGDVTIPDLNFIEGQLLSYGKSALTDVALEEAGALSSLPIPGTGFILADLGGTIDLAAKSVSLSGSLEFPADLGGASLSLPVDKPLVLSQQGISTNGEISFDPGSLPVLTISGFPVTLSDLGLSILNNIPSGNFDGAITLTNFGNIDLGIAVDIDKYGISSLNLAASATTKTYNIADFAELSLSKIELAYTNKEFSVSLDGSITPTNSLVSSITGIGDAITFQGLTIQKDAITLASDLAGWHDIAGASAGFSGATVQIDQYGVGVENNLFWVGLKGQATFGDSQAMATARIFHNGTVTMDDFNNFSFALGSFSLKVARDKVAEAGTVADAQGYISGLPDILINALPTGILNDQNELAVQLHGFKVDFVNRSVSVGSVTYTLPEPISLSMGPATIVLNGLTFSTSSASLAGNISLGDLLPSVSALDFSDLSFSPTAIVYDLPLVSSSDPVQNFEIISGDFGVSLALSDLAIHIDSGAAIPVGLKSLNGSILLGSGYGGISIPNLKLLEGQFLSYGDAALTEGEDAAQNALAALVIPGTEFSLVGLSGSINLTDKSVSMSGSFQFPASLGGGSISLPADKPLTLSSKGISTAREIVFDLGTPPTFSLSGFPAILTTLDLSVLDNLPSGTLAGSVTLTNFANIKLDVEADIAASGVSSLKMKALPEGGTRTFNVADFAELSLSGIALAYENKEFSVTLDGSITPTNSLLSSITGIGDAITFQGLTIQKDAITLASDLAGWHTITGASVGFSGATVQLNQYGIGVENNLFWVGLKGQATIAGAQATATARIFHNGTTAIDGIDLDNFTFAMGDFFLKVSRDKIGEDGTVASAQGFIGGLPDVISNALPAGVLNAKKELEVQLQGFKVDLANRSVSVGTVTYTPVSPITITLGPGALTLNSLSFSTSSASIDGSISLANLGLPISNLPFSDLFLGKSGLAGDIDLIGDAGTQTIAIVDGEFGFSLKLDALAVNIDTRKDLSHMVSLTSFGGGLLFGSGFNDLEIPDLKLLANNAISWGKNSASNTPASLARLVLPGGMFSLGDLGGSVNLDDKSLAIFGTIFLPPSLGSATLTIPFDKPLTLSLANGLSTGGPLVFNPENLPPMSLAYIDSTLKALSIGINNGAISGSLSADLKFNQFADLKVAVTAKINKTGLKELLIDSGNLNRTFNLEGFATLHLAQVQAGYIDDNFFVEIAGDITPTHQLFEEYKDTVPFSGLRIFKSGIEFVDDMGGWQQASGATISINAANVTLDEYGLGLANGAMWFGLKGSAKYLNNEINLTAKIFQNGTFEISDFGFKGLQLALGDFSLRTSAKSSDGLVSGEGFINAGFLSEYLPKDMKDPLTGELKVTFRNLGVDLANNSITSGTVVLPFDPPLTPDLGVFSAVIREVSFGFDGAAVDGDLSLSSVSGIEMPTALKRLSFADIQLSPAGFAGSITYQAVRSPVVLPVLSGDYGITLKLTALTLAVDTTKAALLDKVKLTDLDGAIELGKGYDLAKPVTQLHMLADNGITWGGQLAEMEEGAKKKAKAALGGMSFSIPGTSFTMNNLTGSLYLSDKKMKLWGKVQMPADFGGGSIGLTRENALVLSTSGISTTGDVAIDPGTLGQGFKLAGFGADVSSFSFGVSDNKISGSIAAKIKLAKFDNLPISVSAALGTDGIDTLVASVDEIQKTFNLAGFAELTLTKIGAGLQDGKGFVSLDGKLTLDNDKVAGLAQSFSFSELNISPSLLSLPNVDTDQMFDAPSSAAFSVGDDALSMSLEKYGFTVKDNLFWVAMAGKVTLLNQSLEATARISHKGDFVLDRLGGSNLTIAIGSDFQLRGSFEYADGHITEASGGLYLGSLMDSIPANLKNSFNELAVDVENLDFETVDGSPRLTSGVISFAPGAAIPINNDFFNASFTSISVGVRNSAVFADVEGATISFSQGVLSGLEGLTVSNISLKGNGLSGDVAWAGSPGKSLTVVDHLTYGIKANLTSIGIHFDSSGSTLTDIISLTAIDGSLAFGSGYNAGDITPKLSFNSATKAYTFAAPNSSLTLIQGLKLKDFSGAINFADENITLAGKLVVPVASGEGNDFVLDVLDWQISSTGFSGGIAVKNVDVSSYVGFDPTTILLKNGSITFDHFSVENAYFALDVTLKDFYNLKLAASLGLDSVGKSVWSVDVSTDATLSAETPLATFTASGLGAGYKSESGGLYFSLDATVNLKAAALLSSLPNNLMLSGIEVYKDKIAVSGGEVSVDFNGAKAKLAGVDLTLTKLAIGYENKFYIIAGGTLNIANLCEGGAEIKIYTDLDFVLNKIAFGIDNSAIEFAGELSIFQNDSTYGRGFSATFQAKILGSIPAAGILMVGSKTEESGAFTWWRVALKVSTGSGISLAPVPLSVFALGGGVAYHMSVAITGAGASAKAEFVPDSSNLLVLTALADIGTPDAKTWYGAFELNLEPTNFNMSLVGDSWFMTDTHSGTPDLKAIINIGTSPALFHVAASAKLAKKMGGKTMLGVDGDVDLLFSSGDWHIWFGSNDQRLSLTALEFLKGSGYVKLSSNGLAVGIRQSFSMEGKVWIFYGKVYGGAEVSIAGGIQPFYIDAKGRIWVGLEAGVKIGGTKYEIISAHAELDARFRAPNPTFVLLHGKAHYSFLSGWYSGTWEMDFSMPENSPDASMTSDIASLPIFRSTTPSAGATGVSRVNHFEIKTALPIMEPFYYDDGNWYVLCVKDLRSTGNDDLIDLSQLDSSNHGMFLDNQDGSLLGGLDGSMTLRYQPILPLQPTQSYDLRTLLQLRHFTPTSEIRWGGLAGIVGAPVHAVDVSSHFTTTTDEIEIRELIDRVYPLADTSPVYPDTTVTIDMKNALAAIVLRGSQQSGKYRFDLIDPRGEQVPGPWTYSNVVTDEQTGTQRYSFNLIPEVPIKPFRTVTNMTGEKRYALQQSDGTWINPFTESQESSEPPSSTREPSRSARRTKASVSEKVPTALGETVSGVNTLPEPMNLQSNAPFSVDSNAASTPPVEERWGWDNKYTIQIFDTTKNEKIYGSTFFATIPDDETQMVSGTTQVVRDTLQNPYLFANYTLNQEQYREETNQAYGDVIGEGRCQLLAQFNSGNFAMSGDDEHLCSTYSEWMRPDYRLTMKCYSPSHPATGAANFGGLAMMANERVDDVLNACASSKAAYEALEEEYNSSKEEIAENNSTVNFSSLELRFTTTAPINWHDIELKIVVRPEFNGEITVQGKRITFLTLQLTKGDYTIKSQEGSLEHRIELNLNAMDDLYSSGRFLKYIDLYLARNIPMLKVGSIHVYKRQLGQSNSGSALNEGNGERIYVADLQIKTSRPEGSTYANASGN